MNPIQGSPENRSCEERKGKPENGEKRAREMVPTSVITTFELLEASTNTSRQGAKLNNANPMQILYHD
jgi:hypothetical protein